MLHRPNKGNVEGDVSLFFALLANGESGLLKGAAFGPDVSGIFRGGGFAESTCEGDIIDLGAVSSKPAVAGYELN